MSDPRCGRFRERFDDYHDGLLSPALAEVVRAHLDVCPSCTEEYGLLVSCIGVIRGLDAPAVPPQALRRVVDTLSTQPPPDPDLGLELT